MDSPKRSLADIIALKRQKALELQQEKKQVKEKESDLVKQAPISLESPSTRIEPVLNPTTLPTSLKERLAQIKARQISQNSSKEAEAPLLFPSLSSPSSVSSNPSSSNETVTLDFAKIAQSVVDRFIEENEQEKAGIIPKKHETFSNSIVLNEKQLLAKEMAFSGRSFCLIGAAGTGKTTAQREIAAQLLLTGSLGTHRFRIQGAGQQVDAPSIAFIAYTRIASGNLKRAIHKDPDLKEALVHNITTFHNLLEYSPVTYIDQDTGKECFRFLPARSATNQLDITHLVIEEASMLGLDHWAVLYKAMRSGVQIIFIGDINQLPPVFGDSILNYALVQLPVVELTHVYRQAEDSTIIENAHNILAGRSLKEANDFQIVRSGTINHTQAKLAISYGSLTFPKWMDQGVYDPMEDIILSPWNKRDLGTINMNNWIAQSLGTARKAVVYEILAGRNKLYLAEGDKILFNKRVGIIEQIIPNIAYMGKQPKPHSVNLNRFGTYTGNIDSDDEVDFDAVDYSNLDLDKLLDKVEEEYEEGDRVRAASHCVTIVMEGEERVILSAVGNFSDSVFTLAYALTVHKAQGCEWRKVFILLHRDHSITLSRELLYTAVTRAREGVVIISKEDIINKTIATQRIKGNSLKEKIEYFNGNLKILNNAVSCTK